MTRYELLDRETDLSLGFIEAETPEEAFRVMHERTGCEKMSVWIASPNHNERGRQLTHLFLHGTLPGRE